MAIDARRAGAEAAAEAQRDRSAKLLIVFSSIHYDCAEVLAGVCSVTSDDVLVVGGTSMGEIAHGGAGLEQIGVGSAVVAVALGGRGFTVSTSVVREASADRRGSGAAAASAMARIDAPHKALVDDRRWVDARAA